MFCVLFFTLGAIIQYTSLHFDLRSGLFKICWSFVKTMQQLFYPFTLRAKSELCTETRVRPLIYDQMQRDTFSFPNKWVYVQKVLSKCCVAIVLPDLHYRAVCVWVCYGAENLIERRDMREYSSFGIGWDLCRSLATCCTVDYFRSFNISLKKTVIKH